VFIILNLNPAFKLDFLSLLQVYQGVSRCALSSASIAALLRNVDCYLLATQAFLSDDSTLFMLLEDMLGIWQDTKAFIG